MITISAGGIFRGWGSQFTKRCSKKTCLNLIFKSFNTTSTNYTIVIVIFIAAIVVVVVEDLDVGGRIILKWFLEKLDGMVWTGFIQFI
jgi:hypothetical protein